MEPSEIVRHRLTIVPGLGTLDAHFRLRCPFDCKVELDVTITVVSMNPFDSCEQILSSPLKLITRISFVRFNTGTSEGVGTSGGVSSPSSSATVVKPELSSSSDEVSYGLGS